MIRTAIATIRKRSTLTASVSIVSIRFLTSIADSSRAVPSVASRSMRVLTTPWTKTRAAARATNATTTMSTIGPIVVPHASARSLHGRLEKSGMADSLA